MYSRLARCLHQLGREEEAKLCLEEFMKQHPDHSTSPACTILASDIAKAIINKQREGGKHMLGCKGWKSFCEIRELVKFSKFLHICISKQTNFDK